MLKGNLLQFPLYEDCCNGVSIHPYRPILATCSGQLHPMSNSFLDDEESDSENINSNNESNEKLTLPQDGHNLLNITPVNSFQFWWTGKLNKS